MIKATILASTLYLTPTITQNGSGEIFGIKFTQKITSSLYLKVRTYMTNKQNSDPIYSIKAYLEKDF